MLLVFDQLLTKSKLNTKTKDKNKRMNILRQQLLSASILNINYSFALWALFLKSSSKNSLK